MMRFLFSFERYVARTIFSCFQTTNEETIETFGKKKTKKHLKP